MIRHFKEKNNMAGSVFAESLINFVIFPYQVSINFQKYDFWKYAVSPYFFIFFLFMLLIPLFKKSNVYEIFLFGYIILFIYFIYFYGPRGRYLLPVYPLLCVAGMIFIEEINSNYSKLFFRINIGIMAATILLNIPLLSAQHIQRYKVLFGFEEEEEYLANRMYADGEFYQAIQWTNLNLLKTDKIFVTHQQTFYFNSEIMLGYSPSFPLSPVNMLTVKNANDFYEVLKNNGIKYIFFSEKYAKRFCYNTVELINKLNSENKIIKIKEFANNKIFILDIYYQKKK